MSVTCMPEVGGIERGGVAAGAGAEDCDVM